MIDPASGSLEHLDAGAEGEAKWNGIAAGPDGKLYCAPYNASSVLQLASSGNFRLSRALAM